MYSSTNEHYKIHECLKGFKHKRVKKSTLKFSMQLDNIL